MPPDDDFDDFSHLPSVDESPSAEDKKKLWKEHSRQPHRAPEPQPGRTREAEVMEEQLLAHELPVEQTFAEQHPQHAPEWAEDHYAETPQPASGPDYIIEEPEAHRDGYVIHHPEVDPHRGSITQALRAHQPPESGGASSLPPGNWVREVFQQAEGAQKPEPSTPTKRLTLGKPEPGKGAPPGGKPPREAPPVPMRRQSEGAENEAPATGTKAKKREADGPARLPSVDDADARSTEKLPQRSPGKEKTGRSPKPPLPAARQRHEHGDEDGASTHGDPKLKLGRASDEDDAGLDSSKKPQTPKGEVPHGIPHEPEPELTAKEKFKKAWEKMGGRALAASVVVHIVLLTLAAVFVVTYAREKEVDFLPGGGSKGASEAAEALKHKVQRKRNTWLRNKQPLKRVVSTSMATSITLPDAPPDMDFPDTTKLIGGKGLSGGGFGTSGIGKGFGSGLGFGGKISFMGNSGVGRHIVFAVDVSASMSATGDSGTGQRISRMQLLKNELVKTISRLPPSTFYQVLYFSDFAWPHNEIDSRNLAVFDKYRWTITPDKTGTRIPKFGYLLANPTNVARSIELIKDADNPGGTNWGSGLCMALSGYPKPDIIFFMTDGVKLDSEGWVDAVSAFNLKGGKRSIIHTTAMMEPDAALELDQLAKRNGGNFTIVTAKGFTVTGDEYFKGGK